MTKYWKKNRGKSYNSVNNAFKRERWQRIKNERLMAGLFAIIGLLGFLASTLIIPIWQGDFTYSTNNLYDAIYNGVIDNILMILLLAVGCLMVYNKKQAVTQSGIIISALAIAQIVIYSPAWYL